MADENHLVERVIGHVTVLFGERGGKYPSGNTLLVRGAEESAVIDPSLGLLARPGDPPRADRVLHTHCHEDHFAGSHLFPGIPWHVHEADAVGFRSLDDMMAIYGYPEPIGSAFRKTVVERFHYTPRPDVVPFRDGDVFDLGGGVRIVVLHAPGHTRGHSLLHLEPDDVLVLGDIDLSSFGPYYGDAWSSLEAFETTLEKVRPIKARAYATFHHIGVIEDRATYLDRFDRFRDKIARREAHLVAYLAEPRGLDEIAEHRFVYRRGDPVAFAFAVERRSMAQHLERLLAAGRVREVEPGRYQAVSRA